MDKFDTPRWYFRGEIKANAPHEVWGLYEHVVSIVMPQEMTSEVSISFSYMPPRMAPEQDQSSVEVTKVVKKSGTILVTGRFASVSWTATNTDGITVHYAGYPK